MRRHNISIKDSELRLLQNISKNKVSRSDDPRFWLQAQTKKWRALYDFDNLGKSLAQIQRESYYSGKQRHIVSNDIFSQLQGRFKTYKFQVIQVSKSAKQSVLDVVMINAKTKEFMRTQINVPKQLVINVSDPDVELLKDNDWSVTPS